jgi:hypothetical protein
VFRKTEPELVLENGRGDGGLGQPEHGDAAAQDLADSPWRQTFAAWNPFMVYLVNPTDTGENCVIPHLEVLHEKKWD